MDNTTTFSIPKDVTHGRGYVYALQYHIVWVTKYRKSIFTGAIETDVSRYLRTTLESLDMFPLALSGSSRNQETALGRSSVEPVIFCGYRQRQISTTGKDIHQQSKKQ